MYALQTYIFSLSRNFVAESNNFHALIEITRAPKREHARRMSVPQLGASCCKWPEDRSMIKNARIVFRGERVVD